MMTLVIACQFLMDQVISVVEIANLQTVEMLGSFFSFPIETSV